MYRLRPYCIVFIALLTVVSGASAKVIPTDLASLNPTKEQLRATELITQFLQRYHYRSRKLNDDQSERILAQYLETLDPNRSYFLASDIAEFDKYRHRLDDALRDARLGPAFEIFRRLRLRLDQRIAYALTLLQDGFDFDVAETYRPDRSESPWAADEAELNEIWRKRVKNDALNLALTGKKDQEIVDVLAKRYQRLTDRISQFESDDVFQMFINAYAATIEPHASYLSRRASDNFRIKMSLSLEGIGAALQTENEYTVVRRVIPGGPAALSKQLSAEDRITGVGQGEEPIVDVVGWRLGDVVDLIRGPKGTVVRLQILPRGAAEGGANRIITLVRNQIELEDQAAQSRILKTSTEFGDFNIAVIHVPTFYTDFEGRERGDKDFRSTTRDVRRILQDLKSKDIDGIVVDLRGNGGGSLAEATELTGLFISSGPVVQVRDSSGRVNINDDPDPQIVYAGPLAVMVDRNSASASEIFAGAMQDYHRAVIVGEPTFGKGTVQRLVDLNRFVRFQGGDLGQLKFTIAQFFRINGESTQHRGVIPDIVFPTAIDAQEQGERSLDNALPWASVRPASYTIGGVSQKVIQSARERDRARINNDPGFNYLVGEVKAMKAARDQKTISLLASERRRSREQQESESLSRLNSYRRSLGLAELGSLDEQKDEQDPDVFENSDADNILRHEASMILSDIIAMTRNERLMTQRQQETEEIR